MSNCLTSEGYAVDCCKSGEEALERVATHEYGTVLLDIAMPGMDGWEACRTIKADPVLCAITVYMVTAKPITGDAAVARRANPDGHLLKPFKAEELVELLHRAGVPRSAREA